MADTGPSFEISASKIRRDKEQLTYTCTADKEDDFTAVAIGHAVFASDYMYVGQTITCHRSKPLLLWKGPQKEEEAHGVMP